MAASFKSGATQTSAPDVTLATTLMERSDSELDEPLRYQLSIGGVSIQVSAGRDIGGAFYPGHEPFTTDVREPDLLIEVERLLDSSRISDRSLFDSGTTWRLYESQRGLCFEFGYPLSDTGPTRRMFVDREFTRATLQVDCSLLSASAGRTPILAYPLDELLIMHRLTQEKAIELHGTGIVRANGDANLFVGHSGAGKSTTTRLWTDVEDVEVLSDDRIIVRRDSEAAVVRTPGRAGSDASGHGVPSAFTSGQALRLRDCPASPTNLSAQDDSGSAASRNSNYPMRMYGTPWHGEAMFASPNSAPLTRIFVLEHGHGNVITPLTPSHAVAELFARSFVPFHRHEYVDSALVFLEELANSVPVYRYSFEPDQRAVEKIRQFRD